MFLSKVLPGRKLAPVPLAVIVLVVAALLGGGSRADIVSLIILRPLAVVACMIALWRLDSAASKEHRWFFAFVGAAFVLAVIHLAPLPPALWQMLPGHQVVAAADAFLQPAPLWRPLTLAPEAGRNALFSLFVPLAAGLSLLLLDASGRRSLLVPMLLIALLGVIMSLAQIVAPGVRQLWPFHFTNPGFPVGLFANRNHNAIYLAAVLPFVAVWLRRSPDDHFRHLRMAGAFCAAALITMVIAATASRTGLVLGLFALGGSAGVLLSNSAATRGLRGKPLFKVGAVVAALAVVALSFLVLRATESAERLRGTSIEELRVGVWQTVLDAVPDYLPLGSGLGSFVETYKIHERIEFMQNNYVNHAHNDFLEVLLTLGIPGAVLVALGLLMIAKWSLAVWRRRTSHPGLALGRAASIALLVLIGGSIVDYPLRTPFLGAFLVLGCFWLADAARYGAREAPKIP